MRDMYFDVVLHIPGVVVAVEILVADRHIAWGEEAVRLIGDQLLDRCDAFTSSGGAGAFPHSVVDDPATVDDNREIEYEEEKYNQNRKDEHQCNEGLARFPTVFRERRPRD